MPRTNPEETPKPQEAQASEPVEDQGPDPVEIEALEQKLAALQKLEADLRSKVEAAKPADPKESTPLPEDRLASQATEEEVARAEILRDPFDSRNALKILRNPPGKVLRWLSTFYRENRNMRGWTPVRYDDPIGRELGRYIGEIPMRMEGSSKMDAIVRRGDVFLGWIDYGIWKARQNKRESEAARRIGRHRTKIQETFGQHGSTTDPGLEADANPYQEVRKAPHFVLPDEYRKRSRESQSASRVQGRNMFEEAPDEE